MATLRKKKYYYGRFSNADRHPPRKEVALRTRRKDVARRRLTKLEERYHQGAYDPWKDETPSLEPLTLKEAAERFKDTKRHMSSKTRENYQYALDGLQKKAPATLMIRDVKARHVCDYYMDPKVANATQLHRYRCLKTFFRWAVEHKLIDTSPLDDSPVPREKKKKPAFLSPSDLASLLACIESHGKTTTNNAGKSPDVQWLLDIIKVAVVTGLRRGELLALRWCDVDFDQGYLHVRNRKDFTVKNGSERSIPLAGSALKTLRRLDAERDSATHAEISSQKLSPSDKVFTDRRGLPVKRSRVSHRFKDFVRKAKLTNSERLKFHSLRHTCASWLTMQRVPMRVIQTILGHSSMSVTERYSHLASGVAEKAMRETFGSA